MRYGLPTYCWQHRAQGVKLGAQLSENSILVILSKFQRVKMVSLSCHCQKSKSLTPSFSKPVSGVILGVQAGEERVISLLDRVVQGLIGHDDPLPLLVHVAAQLLEQRPEEDDSVSQRVLQFPD